jgi:DinB superfamily
MRVAASVMPIPASSEDANVVSAILALFHQVHDQLRDAIDGLDASGLNWVPTAGANSIATIVTHVVGSEGETLRGVAGLRCERDREAEFSAKELARGEVLGLLAAADELIAAAKTRIGADRLNALFALPTLPAEEVRSGLTWLLGNYGHAREHVGQIQLTRQFYEGLRSSAS